MQIRQFDIWLADLNPQIGTEAGKTRPVVIVQTNLLNKANHPSTIVIPITTKTIAEVHILRLNIEEAGTGLKQSSDIIIDQLRAIDNNRLMKKLGELSEDKINQLKERINIILDLN